MPSAPASDSRLREVGARGEIRAKLHRDRNAHVLADGAYQVAVAVLELLRGDVGIGGNVEDVQLQRVGACLLHVLGVTHPSAGRAAVQAGDDGNADRFLALAQQVKIAIGTDVVLGHVGQVGRGLGVAVGAVLQRAVNVLALGLDLLFEQRVHHDGRGPGIFQAGKVLQLLRQRRGRYHDRVLQLQSQIIG